MDGHKLVSVIVPAYNVDKYIIKCLDSLKAQTYKNFEVIIVNDGSIDNTEEVCLDYISFDERFRLYSKTNGGLSSARNYGLEKATGSYITFVDSDDYVKDNYLELLVSALENNSTCDVSMSRIVFVNEKESISTSAQSGVNVISSTDAMKMMLLRNEYSHCAYGKMYRKECLEGKKFPEGRLYEDYLTTYKWFAEVEDIACIKEITYFYVQREQSIMHTGISKKVLSLLDVSDEVTDWLISLGIRELVVPALDLQAANYLKMLQRLWNSDSSNQYVAEEKRIYDVIKKNRCKLIFSFVVPVRDKIKILLVLCGKQSFLKVYNSIKADS